MRETADPNATILTFPKQTTRPDVERITAFLDKLGDERKILDVACVAMRFVDEACLAGGTEDKSKTINQMATAYLALGRLLGAN